MTDDRPTVSGITDPTRAGTVLAAFEVAAAAVPLAGGPLAVVLGEIRRSRDTRMAELVIEIDARLRELDTRIDADFVHSADFVARVEAVLDEATRASQASKRRYYATAVKSTAVRERPDDVAWGLLLEALDRVQLVHLAVLAGLNAGPTKPMRPDEVFTVGSGAWRAIDAAVPDLDREVLLRVWEDLASLGIVESLTILTTDARTSTDVGSVIQPFGRRFIEFLELDVDPPALGLDPASS